MRNTEMTNKLKTGDIVHLKSGGPNMTIAEIDKDRHNNYTIFCHWFAGAKRESGWYAEETIVLTQEEQKGTNK